MSMMDNPTQVMRSIELGARLLRAYWDRDYDEIARLRNSDPEAALESALDVAAILLEEQFQSVEKAREHVTALALVMSVRQEWK
jgi:hypothetical protein